MERQDEFVRRLDSSLFQEGTVVVVPSLSFPAEELEKLTAVTFYEERMLFMALFLRNPGLRIVYVTSEPVHPAIVDYYLRFLPDPAGAARRLHLLHLDDATVRCLSQKLLERPHVLERMRELSGDRERACLLPFNVTPAEQALAETLGLPLYGPPTELMSHGTKSGSREVAAVAGVNRLEGQENLFSLPDVSAAIRYIRDRRPGAEAVVVKLNQGTSGQGNAIVEVDGLADSVAASPTTFCADGESWPSFEVKIADQGGIVEEVMRGRQMMSPSVQLWASGTSVEVVSTHDQILGGPEGQQYLGCRFPAQAEYRAAIQREALKVGAVLSKRGVIGWFGIDFLVAPASDGHHEVYLSEVNLRMGGTTHPFWMARLVTEGTYDAAAGELKSGNHSKCYIATDNLKAKALLGCSPDVVIEEVDRAGLGFDMGTKTGTTLHLLGALPGYGKMGATCIANSPGGAEELYQKLEAHLTGRHL